MTSLSLRFTEGETPVAPPELAAFIGVDHALLGEQAADHDDRAPLADLLAAGIVHRHLRMVIDDEPAALRGPVFVTLRSTPIPAPVPEVASEVAEVGAFVLVDRVHGHFAWPRGPAGASLVLAACLPLALPDVALAQSPTGTPGVAPVPAPTSGNSGPARAPVTAPTTANNGTARPGGVPAPAAVNNAGTLEVPPPVVAPPPPPPRITSAATQLETILQGMKGREAVVYAAGAKVTGLIIGVDGDFVTIIDAERDGKIALIPKMQIVEVRGRLTSAQDSDLPTGTGNLVAGGILVGVGAPLMLSGLVFLGITPSYLFIYLPQIIPAGVMLGIGIPNLVTGMKKRRAYQAATQRRVADRLLPAVSRTPHGSWTGGLTLRF